MKLATLTLTLTLALALSPAFAQTPATPQQYPLHNYPLNYATSQADQNEILTAIRNMVLPSVKVFLVPSQNQFVVSASPDQNELIVQMLHMLDVPKPQYRLTYIFLEMDNGKRIGQQQYSMVLAPGQRVVLKEGDRIPVVTGSGAEPVSKQLTYLDVGFNFDSTVTAYGTDGVRLQEKVEHAAIAQEKTSALAEDPIIRQSMVQGVVNLTLGKPQHLGNIDVIGSTRQLQIDALVDVVK